MANYIISCCSTADLSKEHLQKRDIKYICFHYTLDGKQYLDDLGETMSLKDFYQAMVDGAMTQTSQINVEEFTEYFTKFLDQGLDVLHLSLSSGISGVVNSAKIAASELSEKYPDRKIIVIDSLAASAGYGLLMDIVADLRDEGKTIEEVSEWVNANRLKINHWFFTTDLTFFIRGGRVSKVSGWFGTALHICPLLNVDFKGALIPRYKLRGKDRVMKAQVDKMLELCDNGENYNGKCYISNSACYDDARKVADMIEERIPALKGKVEIFDIGTVIGSHTGPGTVALFFVGKERVD